MEPAVPGTSLEPSAISLRHGRDRIRLLGRIEYRLRRHRGLAVLLWGESLLPRDKSLLRGGKTRLRRIGSCGRGIHHLGR